MKNGLPEGWVETTLGDIAALNPGLPESSYPDSLPVSFLGMKAVEAETGKFDATDIRAYESVKKGFTSFINNDVLFAKITPCMENGKVAVVDGLANGVGCGSTEFHVVRPFLSALPRSLIFYYLVREQFRRDARLHMTGSAGQLRVPAGYLRDSVYPLPPLNEQKRIVAKIEELFSDLDAGVAALEKAKAQIKRYRQSVLKAAFDGRLTSEWRAQHKGKLEPASALLERIKAERQKAGGKRTKELPPVDTTDLPELPEGWAWARFDATLENHDGKRVPVSREDRATRHGDYPYYGASGPIDTINGYLFDGEFLLIGEDGANLLARSTPVAFQASGKFWVNNHAHVLSACGNMPLEYFNHFINSIDLAPYITGSAQPKLPQASMNKIPVPLAPLVEQATIASMVEERFTLAAHAEQAIDESLQQAKLLRQSVLKRAFEGRLVQQDPNDEPAERLLERIRAEKNRPDGRQGRRRRG